MAEIFDFYVADNRTIKFNPIEPILQEDNGVAVWRFRIPKVLNNIDMSGFAWWFVYINAAKQKYSEPLTLTADTDDPDNYCIANYTIDYGISLTPGSFTFALEAINANGSGDIIEEWHTKTYSHSVIGTLQGNQAEYSETESDIISALIVQIQQKYNSLVGGATPIPVASVSQMTDTSKIYLLTTDNNWYYYNGTAWVSGGQYASGIVIDPTLTQSGQAADAKVVGDEIEGVKNEVGNLIDQNFLSRISFLENKSIVFSSGVCTITDDSTGKIGLLPIQLLIDNKIACIKWTNSKTIGSAKRVMFLSSELTSLNNGSTAEMFALTQVYGWLNGNYPTLAYFAIPFDKDVEPDFTFISEYPIETAIKNNKYNDVTAWGDNQFRYAKNGFYVNSSYIVSGTRYASNVINVENIAKAYHDIASSGNASVFAFFMGTNWEKIGNKTVSTNDFTIPASSKYMVLFFEDEPEDDYYVYLDINKGVFEPARAISSVYKNMLLPNQWREKKWCSYGDSITECTGNLVGWQNWVTDYYKFSEHYQRGYGGSEISYVTDNPNNKMTYDGHTFLRYGCMWERIIYTIPQDSDLIFVMFGTNDMTRSTNTLDAPVWSSENTLDTAWIEYCTNNNLNVGDFNILSYPGAICSTIVKLQTWCPNAVIVFGTPLSGRGAETGVNYTEQWKNSYDKTTEDYAKACISACEYMSIPVIDVNGVTGINVFNRSKYIKDTVHPSNTYGRMMIARAVIGGLVSIQPMLDEHAYD